MFNQSQQPSLIINLHFERPIHTMPAFGSSNTTPCFGTSNIPFAYGTSNATPAFGQNPAHSFGAQSSPFGSPAIGTSNTTPPFGSSNTSVFGSNTSPFGPSNNPAFGTSNTTPLFGQNPAHSFGAPSSLFSTPGVGSSSTQSFNFGSAPISGQASPFAPTAYIGDQNSSIGSQNTAPLFGQTSVGSQHWGSRIAPHMPTPQKKVVSIYAMTVYKDKCHEELRWADYQRGDKGGHNPARRTSGTSFGTLSAQSDPFSTTAASDPFSTTAASSNPFSTPVSSDPFSTTAASVPFPTTAASSSIFAARPSLFSSTGFRTTSSTATPFSAAFRSTSVERVPALAFS